MRILPSNRINNYYEILFLILFALVPIIDAINGYLLNAGVNSIISIGQLYRGVIILFSIAVIYKFRYNNNLIIYLSVFILYLIFLVAIRYYINKRIEQAIYDSVRLLKLIFPVIIAITIYNLLMIDKIHVGTIDKLWCLYTIIFPLIIYIAYFTGNSNTTYINSNAGLKGFFYATNDITVALLVVFIFTLHRAYTSSLTKGIKVYSILTIIYILIPLLLLGTKSSYVFIIIFIALYIYLFTVNIRDKKNIYKLLVWFFVIAIIIILLFYALFADEINDIINRHLYFLKQESFITYLLSTRDIFLRTAWHMFLNNFHPLYLFLGRGFYEFGQLLYAELYAQPGFKDVEMDFFDIFFSTGLLGLLLVIIFYLLLINIKKVWDRRLKPEYCLAYIFMLIYGFLGGHVMFSALSGTFLGMIGGVFLYLQYKDEVIKGVKRKMIKPVVFMIGPATKGGMSAVIEGLLKSALLNEKYQLLKIISYSGGNIINKILIALKAFAVFIYMLITYRGRPKITHLHVAAGASFFRKSLFLILAKLCKCRVVFHIHGGKFIDFYEKSHKFTKAYISFILTCADAVVVLSDKWKKYISAEMPINDDDIYVIPNFIVADDYIQSHLCNKNILFLGTLCKDKGVYDILDVVPNVIAEYPDAFFMLAGTGEIEAVRAVLTEKKIEDHVQLLGWIDGQQKIDLLSNSYILLQPSYFESFGIAIVEAMASGLPVIASDTGGIPEIICHGRNGFLIKPGDTYALAHYILLLLADRQLVHQIGSRNYKEARERYDENVIIGSWDKLYRRLLR